MAALVFTNAPPVRAQIGPGAVATDASPTSATPPRQAGADTYPFELIAQAFEPQVVDTPPLQFQGQPPFAPRVVETEPLQFEGKPPFAPRVVETEPLQFEGQPPFAPRVVETEPLQFEGQPPFAPLVIETPPLLTINPPGRPGSLTVVQPQPPLQLPSQPTVGSPLRFLTFFALLSEPSSLTRSVGLTVVTADMSWECRDNVCTSEGAEFWLTVERCRELASQVGQISIMMTVVDRLTEAEIDQCNRPAGRAGAAAFQPPPPPPGVRLPLLFRASLGRQPATLAPITRILQTDSLRWDCELSVCTTFAFEELLTVETCRELAARAGNVVSMEHAGRSLDEAEIAACNNTGRSAPLVQVPSPGLITAPSPPPVTLAPGAVLQPLPQRPTTLRVPGEFFIVPPVVILPNAPTLNLR